MKLRTQEVCGKMGVSPTTLKRWVAYFPAIFHKDELGHYLFGEQELELLRHIKAEVRSGVRLEQIRLPMVPAGSARDELAAAVEAVMGSSAGQDLPASPVIQVWEPVQTVSQVVGQAAMKQAVQAAGLGSASAESRASALAVELAAGREQVAGATEAAGDAGEMAALQAQSAIGALRTRMELLERTVSRKADDVVTAQLYHHRLELDEMRQMLRMLAATVEGMQYAGSIKRSEPPAKEPMPDTKASHTRGYGSAPRRQRRKILWLF